MTRPAKPPTQAEIRRARANVETLLLDADILAENSPPREVVGEMVWASMEFAAKNGICATCWLKLAASALAHSLGRRIRLSFEDDTDTDTAGHLH